MEKVDEIIEFCKTKLGLQVSNLQREFIITQIQKRIDYEGFAGLDNYFTHLQKEEKEQGFLFDSFFINYSMFFRDSYVFEYINTNILTDLVLNKAKNKQELRIWSAGCALGEEPYSIAISLREILDKYDLQIPCTIIATDINKNALDKAHLGKYESFSIENMKYKYVTKYFKQNNGQFSIAKSIKQMVIFEEFDITSKNTYSPSSAIYGDFDFVFLRNVLIYLNHKQQKQAITNAYKSLKKNGYLVLGTTEKILNLSHLEFNKLSTNGAIFQKI